MPSGWLRQAQGKDIVSEEEEKARRSLATLQSPVWQLSEAGSHSLQVTGLAASRMVTGDQEVQVMGGRQVLCRATRVWILLRKSLMP